ncbi:MAG: MerR family transcriptional regulator [Chloroflexi bacterium]|nr:MerR family transcriptional regulator [Chloroflexota bacterium]
MMKNYYRTGQFAKKACVSERTLRFYDQVGLLSPSHYSASGYRLYTDDDYPRLQQILGLKYLGFSLDEIHKCLKNGPQEVQAALSIQKAMMIEEKRHLEQIISAIETTEAQLAQGPADWEPIIQVIEAIQKQAKDAWIKKYFNDEQIETLGRLSAGVYTAEDRQKLAHWGKDWSEADQRQADRRWTELIAGVKRLVATGADPAGAEAQALAGEWSNLILEFTHGDPGIAAGLNRWWQAHDQLPAGQAPIAKGLSDQEAAFIQRALDFYAPSSREE